MFTKNRIYYQFKSDCLSTYPLTAHVLLHIPNDMKQQASMHELNVHDGVLVWLTAPSNQITEETLYLLSVSTISGSTVLGDYELIQPFGFDANNYQWQSTIATWEVVSTIRRYIYMSYVLWLSTHIFLDFIMFFRYPLMTISLSCQYERRLQTT